MPPYGQKLSESYQNYTTLKYRVCGVPIANFLPKMSANLSDLLLKFEKSFPLASCESIKCLKTPELSPSLLGSLFSLFLFIVIFKVIAAEIVESKYFPKLNI